MTVQPLPTTEHEHSVTDVSKKVAPANWRDSKRYLWLLVPATPGMVALSWLLVWTTGWSPFWWTGAVLTFVVMPIVDHVLGRDTRHRAPDEALAALENDRYYRAATHLYLPAQYLSLIFACWLWAGGGWLHISPVGKLGLMVATGVVGGVANNAAHELGHKRGRAERWLSKVALAQTCYGQFYVEHNRGHHVRVATAEDPASARFRENVYAFAVRSVTGSTRSAWQLEAKRLARQGHSMWSMRNDVLNAWLLSAAMLVGLTVWFGAVDLPWLAGQALVGIFLLEAMNYVSHYGLRRRRLASGRYEPLRPAHCWNSTAVMTNVFLLHLQRHSDHHLHPLRRFQAVRDTEQAPQLPGGYVAMLVLSLCPPLWRRVMDPRVLDVYGGDISRTALRPRDAKRIARSQVRADQD
ncbi:alkane 1-monooxygenase [Mycolicibacterium sp. 120266]|uniref:alkane 1-monooxygenase n=1 Tax=Mycolicibacterium sp. 120266 TaxID=3090601 RepID=UPI0039A742DB